jgi:hypothetical protein
METNEKAPEALAWGACVGAIVLIVLWKMLGL